MEAGAIRPELMALAAAERDAVAAQVHAKGGYCAACAGTEFNIGDALYLGFLFRDEDPDAYLVALTCCTPDCPRPRTGIVLHANDFLSGAGQSGAAHGPVPSR